jgi:hypothetical protein
MKSRIVIASLSIVLANVRAMADQQPPSDVDLIPDAAIQQPEAAPSSSIDRGNQRIYLEDALTGSDIRNNLLVPYPSPQRIGRSECSWMLAKTGSSMTTCT